MKPETMIATVDRDSVEAWAKKFIDDLAQNVEGCVGMYETEHDEIDEHKRDAVAELTTFIATLVIRQT